MRSIALSLLLAACALHSHAQTDENNRDKRKLVRADKATPDKSRPVALYIGLSTGINNNTGVFGIHADVPVAPNVSVDGGFGSSSWGRKFELGAKYYLKQDYRGWAFGGGLTHSSGTRHFDMNLETTSGTQEFVSMSLRPLNNVFIAAYNYWLVGRRANRMYVELGLSRSISEDRKFIQYTGSPITDRSRTVINLLSPGGLIVAFGFDLGIHKAARITKE